MSDRLLDHRCIALLRRCVPAGSQVSGHQADPEINR